MGLDGNDTYVLASTPYATYVCYLDSESGKWYDSASALATTVPYLLAQILTANFTYRIVYHLTRPFYLPPAFAQIFLGFLFNPALLGGEELMQTHVFPLSSTLVLETIANIAVIYNMFLLGLEMDLNFLKLADQKTLRIASAGIVVPLVVGFFLYFLPGNGTSLHQKSFLGCLYYMVALSCTNFRDLSRILADLKLLRSDIGKIAMPVAIITDLSTWILLVVNLSLGSKLGHINMLCAAVLMSMGAFVLYTFFVVRPVMKWMFAKAIKRGHISENLIWFVLVNVMVSGMITDALGTHSIVGAFVFGLMVPRDQTVRGLIEEKLYDFLAGILMPLYFILSGLRSDFDAVNFDSVFILAVITCVSFFAKIVSTFVVGCFHKMPVRDSLALGLLLNSKGVLSVVVLNTGRDNRAVDSHTFTTTLNVMLLMSMLVEPVLAALYNPNKRLIDYKHRSIETLNEEAEEFRILVCIHHVQNASGIINILDISNPTKQSPINVLAVHLVELTGRTTASILIMNDENKPKFNFSDRVAAESDQISEILETVEVNNEDVMVNTVTVVSPYATMHDDICGLAEDKRVTTIILPYHMQLSADGKLEDGNPAHAEINRNVLQHSPCSVGILIERGMGTKSEQGNKHVLMLFLGGPDDREALSYAWRMVGDQATDLTVVRFVPSPGVLQEPLDHASSYLDEKDKEKDEEFIYEFTFKTANDSSVTYIEKVVNDGQETIAVIRDIEENSSYDLYVVGRGYGLNSPVTMGLSDWGYCPELGIMGDTLAASSFVVCASVLVIQQYSEFDRFPEAIVNEFGEPQKRSTRDVDPIMAPSGRGNGLVQDDDDSDY